MNTSVQHPLLSATALATVLCGLTLTGCLASGLGAGVAVAARACESQRRPATPGRSPLTPEQVEDSGYSLHSYLLLGRKPNASARPRVRAVFAQYLAWEGLAEMHGAGFCKDELNVTHLPLREAPPEDIWQPAATSIGPDSAAVTWLIDHYDYARALAIASRFPADIALEVRRSAGPFIVSTPAPASAAAPPDRYLWQDLSAANPRLAGAWMDTFNERASEPRSWEGDFGADWALELRNEIANVSDGVGNLPELLSKVIVFMRQ